MTVSIKARRVDYRELVDIFAEAIGIVPDLWYGKCHEISLAIVQSGVLGEFARVARGTCDRYFGQHSWISLGDPYNPDTRYLDPTSWTFQESEPVIWSGRARGSGRMPKGGDMTIWDWGRPDDPIGPIIELTPDFELSDAAQFFLSPKMLGPLDRQGWATLSSAPVLGWPAGEIFAAMDDTPELSALVPIDILGMTTDRNPCDLYLANVPDTSGAVKRRAQRETKT